MEPSIQATQQQPIIVTKSNKSTIITLIIVTVLLIVGIAVVGYFFKQEVDKHSKTTGQLDEKVKQLADLTKLVDENAQIIRDAKLEPAFRKVLQDHANQECTASKSAVLFNTTTSLEKNGDGSIKKYFAVGQFICNNGGMALASPIRFSAAQSKDGITWEFTYGSSSGEPTSLPSYIFNTDPALYNRKYNNPRSF